MLYRNIFHCSLFILFNTTNPPHPASPPSLCSPSHVLSISGNCWKGRRHVSAPGSATPPPPQCPAIATSPVCTAALALVERRRSRMMTTNISRAANPAKAPPSPTTPIRVTRSTLETWTPPTRKTKRLNPLSFFLSSLCLLHYLLFPFPKQPPSTKGVSERNLAYFNLFSTKAPFTPRTITIKITIKI